MWKRWFNKAIDSRRARIYAVVYGLTVVLAVAVAWVPLFNILGYESAALFGAVLGLVATGLSVWSIQRGLSAGPLSAHEAQTNSAEAFGELALFNLGLMAGPLVVLSLNGLRVPVCDWGTGIGFWALIVFPAILLGQGAAWLGHVLFDRWWGVWAVALGLPLVDALALAWHLATEPPIIGHQWFIGYFAGSIYDEALGLPTSLVAYRAIWLAALVALVAGIQALWRWREQGRRPTWSALLCVAMALAAASGWIYRQEFGIGIDRDHIIEELGGTVESDHFVIHYPNQRDTVDRLEEMIADHEFRYAQMRDYFGVDPVAKSGRKVRSFVYADPDSKGALMGARHTMVAKLWLGEMHILWRHPGDSMLAHELAHIFTEPFGAGPLRLSMQRGIGVNMGLVEGIATAAEWSGGELTPHEATAAMRQLEMAPDLRRLFGATGFWTEASGPAYTAMGSFVRFLVDEEGMDAFKEAYPRGDFEGAYGRSVEALIDDWEAFLDDLELEEAQMRWAEHRYGQRSIFQQVCARALAEQQRRGRHYRRAGALERAEEVLGDVLEADDSRLDVWREWIDIKRRLGAYDDAYAAARAVRSTGDRSAVEQARLLALKGDIRWAQGEGQAASSYYGRALSKEGESGHLRGLTLKKRLADVGHRRGREVLVEERSTARRIYTLTRWIDDGDKSREAKYLLGRLLWQRGDYDEALGYLKAIEGHMGSRWLDDEAALMLGQSLLLTGRLQEAASIWEALGRSELGRSRHLASLWAQRHRWAEDHVE